MVSSPWIRIVALSVGLGAVATQGQAEGALALDAAAWAPCIGQTTCSIPGLQLSAAGATATARLSQQIDRARGAVPGLGVEHDLGNGFNDAELQGPVGGQGGERLVIAFDTPQTIAEITLVYLFNPAHVPGDPAETALISASLGDTHLGRIAVTSVDDATVTLDGPAEAAKLAASGSGTIRVLRPFAGRSVDRLVFSATAVTAGDSSDYALGAILTGP
ncbi:MAG: hypothetical protein AAGC57_08645 [Pseudomonadota bacterium]